MKGLKLAALYSLRPNYLGHCGPREERRKETLLRYLRGEKISEKEVRRTLESFEGAYNYYKLLARKNGVKDCLSKKIVDAYWKGNPFVEKVRNSELKRMVNEKFLTDVITIPKGSIAHHSFDVLFMGARGRLATLEMLDACRICWGEVKTVSEKVIEVEYQPLIEEEKGFSLGEYVSKEVIWNKDILNKVNIGDWITFHWSQVVEVISEKGRKELEKYTKVTLDSLKEL